MKYVSVLASADSEMYPAVKQVLEELGFEVLPCADTQEAELLVEKHLPHLLVMDHSLGPVFRGGEAGTPRLVVLAREINAGEIASLKAHRLADCLLFPMTYSVLYRRLKRVQLGLARTPVYLFDDQGDASLSGWLEFDGKVLGICETGIAVVSNAATAGPAPEAQCLTKLFERIGVPMPRLKLLESRPKAPTMGGEEAFVSYFQISGWKEDDRMRLRRWEKDERLKPQALARGGG